MFHALILLKLLFEAVPHAESMVTVSTINTVASLHLAAGPREHRFHRSGELHQPGGAP